MISGIICSTKVHSNRDFYTERGGGILDASADGIQWELFLGKHGRAWSFLFLTALLPSATPEVIRMVPEKPYQTFYGTGRVPRRAGQYTVTLHRGDRSTLVLVSPRKDRQMTMGFLPRAKGVALGGAALVEVADLQPKTPLVIDGVAFKAPMIRPLGQQGKVLLSDGMSADGLVLVLPGY